MIESCPICGKGLKEKFDSVEDPLSGDTFAIWECEGCQLGLTQPRPEDLKPYYDASYYGKRHGFTLNYCMNRRLRFLGEKGKGERCLLDVGCGDGTFLLEAQKRGWTVFGTELNPQDAQASGLTVESTTESLRAYAPFDCITLWHSLEHIEDLNDLLANLTLLLKPDGKILIAVPDNGGWHARLFKEDWLHLDVPRHLFHFNRRALASLLKNHGLRVSHSWNQELEYDLLGFSQSVLNCFSHQKNVFFDALRGKKRSKGFFNYFVNMAAGLILTLIGVPFVLIATLCKRGGTLIVEAKRESKP